LEAKAKNIKTFKSIFNLLGPGLRALIVTTVKEMEKIVRMINVRIRVIQNSFLAPKRIIANHSVLVVKLIILLKD